MLLLVGDNPFLGISHLSQRRSRERETTPDQVNFAANLVLASLQNGANGFMFSVNETTLSIIRAIREKNVENFQLYALVPYAYEYVRLATQFGGVSGLARKMIKEIVLSMNMRALLMGAKGVARMDLTDLLKTYVSYETSRIRSIGGKQANLKSVLLHELITEMALALDLDWILTSYIDFMLKNGITPGFETRNFAYLVKKLEELDVDFRKVIVAAPFNRVGFQMNPSKSACEEALASLPARSVIAMSILAAGYVRMPEAVEYIRTLPKLKGVVVGVSKESHALETFRILRNALSADQ